LFALFARGARHFPPDARDYSACTSLAAVRADPAFDAQRGERRKRPAMGILNLQRSGIYSE
jgi:hypothetical protein